MGSAFHQLYPRYSGTLTPITPTAIRRWETFTFTQKSQNCPIALRKAKFVILAFLSAIGLNCRLNIIYEDRN